MQEIAKALIIFGVIFTSTFSLQHDCYAKGTKYVRVAVLENAESLSLKVSGAYEVIDSSSEEVLLKGRNLKTTVTSYKGGILLAGKVFSLDKILVKTSRLDPVSINGRNFRGNICLIKDKFNKLDVINYIELEDYVKGISVRETSHYWPVEALKAQVIVFRTYALYQIEENKSKDFDVTSDIYSQVYGGRAAERYRINKTVDETRGMILRFGGEILPAFYHATCAGHTESATELWNIDIVPLKGVPCKFCKESPHYNWHYVLDSSEAKDKLSKAGYNIKQIKGMVVISRNNSGRVAELKIITPDKELKIKAKDFRSIIGPNLIKSTNFSVSVIKDDIIFEGLGWGHGVGLCQWGAYFMAKDGYDYKKILEYYYPGADLSQ